MKSPYLVPVLAVLSGCVSQEADCVGGDGKCSVAHHDASEPVRRGDFEPLLKAYLDDHPEIVADMSQKLRVKQAAERQAKSQQVLAESRVEIFEDAADPILGNPMGDITVVEFFDNECPFCKRLSPALEQLVSKDAGIKVVLKEFPILGSGSEVSARYALAAIRQGKYAEFHKALMADKTAEHQLAEPRILEIAGEAGLDVAKLRKDATEPDIAARIESTRSLARKLAITGTPGLIVGNKIESGALSLEALQQAVAEERRAQHSAG